MGYMAEGVIVGTIYDPLPFYWVWTPLAWHALISGGLVFGIGRAGHALGPGRMAAVWAGLGLGAAYWGQYWPSEATGPLPGRGGLAVHLLGFGGLVVLAQWGMDRLGHLPRPPHGVLAIAPGDCPAGLGGAEPGRSGPAAGGAATGAGGHLLGDVAAGGAGRAGIIGSGGPGLAAWFGADCACAGGGFGPGRLGAGLGQAGGELGGGGG